MNTVGKVEEWAKERNLDKAEPYKQVCKLVEEMGELAEGIIKDKPEQVKDSIGDCAVVLIILSMQLGLSFEDCLDYAYDEIKNRTGKTVNGIFVKSEDLLLKDSLK